MRVLRHRATDPQCGCDDCWTVRRLAVRRYRSTYSFETGLPIDNTIDAEHGTLTMFRRGCRCDACRDARSVYRRVRAERLRGER